MGEESVDIGNRPVNPVYFCRGYGPRIADRTKIRSPLANRWTLKPRSLEPRQT